VFQTVIDDVAIKVQLTRVFGFEHPLLQVDDHERPQTEVIKEQIDVEILPTDIETVLSA
jgi:hypothetical protein